MRVRLSIVGKLFLVSLILLCLATKGMSLLIYQNYLDALLTQAKQDFRYQGQLDAAQLKMSIRTLQQELKMLTQWVASSDPQPEAVLALLNSFMHHKPMYRDLTYWSLAGEEAQQWQLRRQNNQLVVTHQQVATKTIPHYDKVKLLPRAHGWLSDFYQAPQDQQQHLQLQAVLPLSVTRAKRDILIMLTLDLRQTLVMMQSSNDLPLGIGLMDKQGKQLFEHAMTKDVVSKIKEALVQTSNINRVAIASQQDERFWRMTDTKQTWLVYTTKVYFDPTNATRYVWLVMSLPERTVLDQHALLRYKSLLIIVSVLLLTTLLIWLLGKHVTRDLLRLTQTAKKVSQGEMPDCLPTQRSDEVGLLAQAMATMLEKIRQRTQALEHSNQELTQFAYVASHDLKEPLRKLKTFTTILQQDQGKYLSAQGLDFLARMSQAVDRMRSLIDALLEYAKITNRQQPFVMVDLQKILGLVLYDLSLLIEESGATVTLEGSLPQLQGDEIQLRQLLQNLVVNALKYHKPGVPPEIRIVSQIEDLVIQDKHMSCAVIQVVDNGIGFKQEQAGQLFSMFACGKHGHDLVQGAGIGLATCQRVVQRHGGLIKARGQVGVGATFIVILPLVSPSATL